MREQLFIKGVELPLSRSLDPSFTKSIIDIKEPEKRSSAYSKTVTVPNSKEAAKVFGFAFEINSYNTTFNPNLRADCVYLVDGNEQIRGYCQLKDLIKTNNHDIEYQIVMFSEFGNLFKDIQNKWLDEVEGIETYDHILNKELQNYSVNQEGVYQIIEGGVLVSAALGKGYIYPLVDYGFSTDGITFKVTDIGCSIFVKEYWDRIFADAGKTYEFTDSNFEDHFKHLIVPSSPEAYLLDASEIADREFQSNTPKFTSTGTTTSGNISKVAFTSEDPIIFSNELVDDGGVYNPLTGLFTCTANGWYNFATIINVIGRFIPSTGGSVNSVGYIDFKTRIIKYDSFSATFSTLEEDGFLIQHDGFAVGARESNSPTTYPDDDYFKDYGFIGELPRYNSPPNQLFLSVSNVFLRAGDTIKIAWIAQYKTDYPSYFVDGGGSFSDGQARIKIEVGSFFNKVANLSGIEGNLLKIRKCIPKVKQIDFILNYVKEYNLYFEIDPDKTDHFLIAPRDSFYTNTVRDISDKVSIDQGITIEPIGALDAKAYIYKHKDDTDYLNTRYKSKWLDTYGQREITVLNDFNEKENKTEVSASPTPLADNGTGINRVLSTIVQVDELGQKISTASNWRTLYYGGQLDCQEAWLHSSTIFASKYYLTYPYAGHFDHPFTPTLDINFGLVREVYYDDFIETIIPTDNNLYNKYYSKFIREITDKDSKYVRCMVNISAFDYSQWKFSDLFYFGRSYFRLNKIDGFNPTNNELTKCEFLKLKEVSPFKPTVNQAHGDGVPFEPDTDDGSITTQVSQVEYMPLKGITQGIKKDGNIYNSQSATVGGTGNVVSKMSYSTSVTGDNNVVSAGCQNITLIGCSGVFIGSNLQNVTMINCTQLSIQASNVIYINNQLQS
jgi:hypothetical protein